MLFFRDSSRRLRHRRDPPQGLERTERILFRVAALHRYRPARSQAILPLAATGDNPHRAMVQTRWSSCSLVKRQRRLRACDRDLRSALHLLEGAHLDLAHPLPRNAELGRKLLQRDRLVGELACLEDTPLARA